MRLYIVRHAETEGPDLCKFQNPRTPLSSNGNKQAKFLALRFADLSIDCILSSPHLRALQTAEAISESKSLPIISSTLISGIRHPSAVTDRYKNDPEVVRIMMEVEANFLNESSAKFDEETFDDLISRAREALDFFLSLGKESILIVTHGNYVKLILALMMYIISARINLT